MPHIFRPAAVVAAECRMTVQPWVLRFLMRFRDDDVQVGRVCQFHFLALLGLP